VVVYSGLIGSCQGSGSLRGSIYKILLMQRLAILLLSESSAFCWLQRHMSQRPEYRNKAGGIAVTYVAAKPPVEAMR